MVLMILPVKWSYDDDSTRGECEGIREPVGPIQRALALSPFNKKGVGRLFKQEFSFFLMIFFLGYLLSFSHVLLDDLSTVLFFSVSIFCSFRSHDPIRGCFCASVGPSVKHPLGGQRCAGERFLTAVATFRYVT